MTSSISMANDELMTHDRLALSVDPVGLTPDGQPVPRPEYPRPNAARQDWMNLNGTWQFEIDRSDSGLERGMVDRELSAEITVPFAPESQLSGVENTDFMAAVWYRRHITIPEAWSDLGDDVHILVHFGAVDHDATVWANGVEVARHRGGFTPFTADLDGIAGPGDTVTLVVRARDSRHGAQARGKQSTEYANDGCYYTRTTGIWQTVWAEPVPATRMGRPHIIPDVAASGFRVRVPLTANRPGWSVHGTLDAPDGTRTAEATVRADLDREPSLWLQIPEEQVRLWSPGKPHLYGLQLELRDESGEVVDRIASYAGLRSVTIRDRSVLINGEPVFQRLVLDQGYWPQSLMTAPSDQALRADIELAMAAGFNGARLHQRVVEERYLYHADRLGYLVWAEFADWGANVGGPSSDHQRPTASFVAQWSEELERDRSHPAIVGWCPLNETFQELTDRQTVLDDVTHAMVTIARLADGTRPVLDASGYSHRDPSTEVWDAHNYEQDPQRFARLISGLAAGQPFANCGDDAEWSIHYAGQPYFISEFGGIWWDPQAASSADGNDVRESWGYGDRVDSEESFQARFAGLTGVLLADPQMFGYCYTQLTDVFQERNGIYRFDRSEKLDVDAVRAAQLRTAAYERY
jgi:beta-galactosidase/beta-glucuronidase